MAKLKKGSDEAKAYMASIRPDHKRKAVKSRYRGVKNVSKRKESHKQKTVWHVLPDLAYAGAVVSLAGPPATGAIAQYNSIDGTFSQKMGSVAENMPGILMDAKAGVVPAIEFFIAGKVIAWAGKIAHLNRIGTKEVKLA